MVRRTIELPRVRTHSQDLEDFDPRRIKEVYVKEAGLSASKANHYTKMILIELERLYLRGKLKVLTTRMIRELMCAYAIQEGDFETRDRLTVLGMPIYDVEKLFFKYDFDNSNQIPSEEFLHKMKGDWMDDEYSLLKLYNFDTKWGNPAYHHLNGDIHIHDRDYPARPFCYQHSARFIFRSGLKIDGSGKYCNVSRAPKRLDVAVKLICEFLGAASRNWAGGQSFRNPFWELGPFIEDEAKRCKKTTNIMGVEIPETIVQAAQVMRYEPNHILVGRGSQAAFSSISNFARPPLYLTDDADVILPGGKVEKGDYSAYTDSVMKFWLAYLNESIKGDASGSLAYDERVPVYDSEGRMRVVRIGEFCDGFFEDNTVIKDREFEVVIPENDCFSASVDLGTFKMGKHKISKIIRHPAPDKLLRITTEHGKQVVITPNHSLFGFGPSGDLMALAGEDLREGNVIAVASSIHEGSSGKVDLISLLEDETNVRVGPAKDIMSYVQERPLADLSRDIPDGTLSRWNTGYTDSLPLDVFTKIDSRYGCDKSKYYVTHRHKTKDAKIPALLELTPAWGAFLGRYIADGAVSQHHIHLAYNGLDGGEHQACKELFNAISARTPWKNTHTEEESCKSLVICNTIMAKIVRNLLGTDSYAHTKRVPEAILNAEKETRLSFVKEYLEGDGYGNEASTVSEDLSHDLGYLALTLGYYPTFGEHQGGTRTLRGRTFKARRSYRIYLSENERLELLPHAGLLIKKIREESGIGKNRIGWDVKYEKLQALPSRNKVKATLGTLEKLGIGGLEKLRSIAEGDVCGERIQRIEEVPYDEPYVYDLEVMVEGKEVHNFVGGRGIICHNSMFHWMKDDIGIKPKWFKDSELNQHLFGPLMQYIAKFGGPYIHNIKHVKEEEVACTSCCSLVLASKDPHDFELAKKGTLGMGALQCGSINLPRIAYLAKGDDATVDELLYRYMNVIREMMMAKYRFMDRIIKAGVTPFLTQPKIPGKDESPYFELEKQSMLLSFVGLNEFAKAHLGQELHESREAHRYGMRIVQKMLKTCDEFSKKEGLTFSIWRQPAETVAGRFAQLDYKKFNGQAIINGDPKVGAGYYSNFTHANVNSGLSVFEKIKQEAPFHGLSPSNLMHIWLGEMRPDPDSLWELTQKIIDKSLTNYFAFTKDISVCTKCNTTQPGIIAKCKCGAGPGDIALQSRITGYYSTVGTVAGVLDWRNNKHKAGLKHAHWQPSKFAEFNDRMSNMAGQRFTHVE